MSGMGTKIILSSSFIGGARYMIQNYLVTPQFSENLNVRSDWYLARLYYKNLRVSSQRKLFINLYSFNFIIKQYLNKKKHCLMKHKVFNTGFRFIIYCNLYYKNHLISITGNKPQDLPRYVQSSGIILYYQT